MPELPAQPHKQLAAIEDGTQVVIAHGYFHEVITDESTNLVASELGGTPLVALNRQRAVKTTLPTTEGGKLPCLALTLGSETKYYYPDGEFGFNPRNKE